MVSFMRNLNELLVSTFKVKLRRLLFELVLFSSDYTYVHLAPVADCIHQYDFSRLFRANILRSHPTHALARSEKASHP